MLAGVAAAGLALAYFYLRFPVRTGHGDDYFTNYIFVYKRQPYQCSFIGCFAPDLIPFTRDSVVWGADPFSFRFVGSLSPRHVPDSPVDDIYRDKDHVIYGGGVVLDSDPDSLELFDGYAKDKKHVYLNGRVSKKLDPATFELLGCGFYRDRNGVYHHTEGFENAIPVSDKDSFEVIDPRDCYGGGSSYVARDRNHMYRLDASGFGIIR